MPPLLRRLLLLLISTLIACVLGELLFRVFGPSGHSEAVIIDEHGNRVPGGRIIHFLRALTLPSNPAGEPSGGMKPGARFRIGYQPRTWDYFDADGCVWVEINQRGVRDLDFPVAKPKSELRILAVGDSFTFGHGVTLELSWPQRLEGLLRDELGRPVEVINAGYAGNGHTAAGYAPWLASDGMRFGPDLVLVGFCLNDFGEIPMLSYEVVPLQPILGGFSRALDHLVHMVRQRAARQRDKTAAIRVMDIVRDWDVWKATQRGLQDMQRQCQAAGIPLVVAILPMLTELERYPYARLHAILAEFCQANGIRCLDLAPAFAGRRDEDLWVHPTDQHPNHVATAIIAEKIRDYLRAEGLLGAK